VRNTRSMAVIMGYREGAATMDLRRRYSGWATGVSFLFLAAIVFGAF
jgi:hypothetical protein